MRVIVAPDKFKGTFKAIEVCRCLEGGIRRVRPGADVSLLPAADGGEGTVEALLRRWGGRERRSGATGPLGTPVEAIWGEAPEGRAVVESSSCTSIHLMPVESRDPLKATTYGLGELVREAVSSGSNA